jgi:hypothetical protein
MPRHEATRLVIEKSKQASTGSPDSFARNMDTNTMKRLLLTSLTSIATFSISCVAPVDIEDRGDVEETIAAHEQAVERAPLRYGSIYHLQNGYNGWGGGYLDTRAAGCSDNALCVSTASSDNRDTRSGSWRLISADGKAYGEPVRSGDRVHLANMYPRNYSGDSNLEPGVFGGFLDTRGRGCADNALCVSTSWSHNRDSGSGLWIIESSADVVTEGQSIRLRNDYRGGGGYLDTRGRGCQDNMLCVSTSNSADRDSGSGSWRMQLAEAGPGNLPRRSDLTLDLIRSYVERFAPIVVLHPDDPYRPDSVDTYLQSSALHAGLVFNEGDHDTFQIFAEHWYSSPYVRSVGVGASEANLKQYLSWFLSDGAFRWSYGGPIQGMTCTAVNEPADPDAWSDNYFCNKLGIPFTWSHAGPIQGMNCVQVNEPSEPASYGWNDNYLCHNTGIDFQWSFAGPIAGKECVQFNEPSDPHTWSDNYLCHSPLANYVKLWLSPDTNQDAVRRGSTDRAKSYVTVENKPGVVTIQYWYFYPYNGPGRFEVCLSSHICEQIQIGTVGRHEGDWEHVDVDVLPSGAVADVRLSRHGDEVRAIDQVAWEGSHPVVYSAFYSHAHYPSAGTQYYNRPWSTYYGFGTASVDLYDRTADGPRWATGLPGKYEIVAIKEVEGVSVPSPDWTKLAGRWGAYERLSHTHSVNYGFGTYSYTQKEVGAGPTTPRF